MSWYLMKSVTVTTEIMEITSSYNYHVIMTNKQNIMQIIKDSSAGRNIQLPNHNGKKCRDTRGCMKIENKWHNNRLDRNRVFRVYILDINAMIFSRDYRIISRPNTPDPVGIR